MGLISEVTGMRETWVRGARSKALKWFNNHRLEMGKFVKAT